MLRAGALGQQRLFIALQIGAPAAVEAERKPRLDKRLGDLFGGHVGSVVVAHDI